MACVEKIFLQVNSESRGWEGSDSGSGAVERGDFEFDGRWHRLYGPSKKSVAQEVCQKGDFSDRRSRG